MSPAEDGFVRLRASDGHELDAYLARPGGRTRGGLVIGQEMYGVTDYLRSVADDYAEQGYLAIVPALYDRAERGLVFAYSKEDHARAQPMYKSMAIEPAIEDLDAARAHVASAGLVGLLGFCWGGSLGWLSASRKPYDAVVAYYGPMMLDHADEQPRCPVIAHVGSADPAFPPERLEAFRAAQPSVPVYLYEGAPHGFDNSGRVDRYDAEAHRLARRRSVEFLRQHIG